MAMIKPVKILIGSTPLRIMQQVIELLGGQRHLGVDSTPVPTGVDFKSKILSVLIVVLITFSCSSCNDSDAPIAAPPTQQFVCLPQNVAAVIIDNTRSAIEKNAIPKVTSEDVVKIARRLAQKGGGPLRIEPVIEDARKSIPFKLQVPSLQSRVRPKSPVNRNSDQDFYKVLAAYNGELQKFIADSLGSQKTITRYLDSIQPVIASYLDNYYSQKRRGSDINGALANCYRFIEAFNLPHKVIFAMSDLVHDLHLCNDYHPMLPDIPANCVILQIVPNRIQEEPACHCKQYDALDISLLESTII